MKVLILITVAAACGSPRGPARAPVTADDSPPSVARDAALFRATDAAPVVDTATAAVVPEAPGPDALGPDTNLRPVPDAVADRGLAVTPRALLVGGAKTAGDPPIRKRLEGLGFQVAMALDTAPRPPGDYALIVITESAESDFIGTKYTSAASPIVTSENRIFTDLGLSSAPSEIDREQPGQRSIVVVNPASPLAAGLSGKVDVLSSAGRLDFAIMLAPTAIKVATLDPAAPDGASKVAVFAYEKGALLANGKPAPARRAAWFVEDLDVEKLTPAGWKIFDACVRWASAQP